MFLTRDQAAALFIGFNAQFQNALTKPAPSFWQDYATLMPSNTKNALYHWVDQLPDLREWIGSRTVNNAALRDYTLPNKNFEHTLAFNKFDLDDDIHGAYGAWVQAQGAAAARWPDVQMAAVVKAGTTASCFDGHPFFYGTHPLNMDNASGGTYSNLLTGATYDLSADPTGVWQRASEAMAGFKGAGGAPLNLIADTLMVPPSLRRWAVEAAKAELVPQSFAATGPASAAIVAVGSKSNVYVGDFTIIINTYIEQASPYGIVMCSKAGINPFIWQLRQAPVFIPQTDPSLSQPFYNQEFVFGVEARGAGGYSLPFLAVRIAAA